MAARDIFPNSYALERLPEGLFPSLQLWEASTQSISTLFAYKMNRTELQGGCFRYSFGGLNILPILSLHKLVCFTLRRILELDQRSGSILEVQRNNTLRPRSHSEGAGRLKQNPEPRTQAQGAVLCQSAVSFPSPVREVKEGLS